jgi:hypothetical protein
LRLGNYGAAHGELESGRGGGYFDLGWAGEVMPRDEIDSVKGLSRARRRFGIIAVVLVGVPIVAWTLWFFFHGGGDEPPPPDDDLRAIFVPVPEDENGFALVYDAARNYRIPDDPLGEPADENPDAPGNEWGLYHQMCDGKLWNTSFAEKVLELNRRAFELFEEGLRKPHFQGPRREGPWCSVEDLVRMRGFAPLVKFRSLARFENGREREAFEAAGDLIRLGRLIQNSNGIVAHYSQGAEIKRMGCETIREFLPRTRLAADELRQSVGDSCIADQRSHEGLAYALKAEYARFAETIDLVAKGSLGCKEALGGSPVTKVSQRVNEAIWRSAYHFKPNTTKRLMGETTRVQLRNLAKPESEREQIGRGHSEASAEHRTAASNSTGRYFCEAAFSGLDKVFLGKALEEADLSATRLLIALKCFKLATGSLPASLDALVPKYIEAVPRDPFDGKPFRYSPEKKIVHSVGPDLEDEGGAEEQDGSSIEKEPTYRIDF